jgi:DNA-binding NarL/FixJ family response regulator
MRLLIADDSELIVDRLIASLESIKGVEIVETAGTVERASEAVRALRPDVVILDMQMPGGSGLDVLESMKRDQVRSVVIVLTNFAYPQYKRKCFASGANFFLDKSTEFDKVGDVLRTLLPTLP